MLGRDFIGIVGKLELESLTTHSHDRRAINNSDGNITGLGTEIYRYGGSVVVLVFPMMTHCWSISWSLRHDQIIRLRQPCRRAL